MEYCRASTRSPSCKYEMFGYHFGVAILTANSALLFLIIAFQSV